MQERRRRQKVRRNILVAVGIVGLSLVFFCHSAQAVPITVSNSSFETPLATDVEYPGYYKTNTADDWFVGGSAGVWNPLADSSDYDAFYSVAIPDGTQIAWSNGGSLTQAVGTVQANTTYTLTVYVGERLDLDSTGYTIEIVVDGTSVASVTQAQHDTTKGEWILVTATYVSTSADSGKDLEIRLTGIGGGETDFDKIQLDATTPVPNPEPSTILLIGTGLVGFAVAKRNLKGKSRL